MDIRNAAATVIACTICRAGRRAAVIDGGATLCSECFLRQAIRRLTAAKAITASEVRGYRRHRSELAANAG